MGDTVRVIKVEKKDEEEEEEEEHFGKIAPKMVQIWNFYGILLFSHLANLRITDFFYCRFSIYEP